MRPHHTKIDLFWPHRQASNFKDATAVQPYFRSFSNRLSQPLACAATFFGAVPPKLVRLFTDASTDSTESASLVIFGSIIVAAYKMGMVHEKRSEIAPPRRRKTDPAQVPAAEEKTEPAAPPEPAILRSRKFRT